MKNNFYIVLMNGGAGTRLWPVSRESLPKQFHKLTSEKSLLEETYERIKVLTTLDKIFVSLGPKAVDETRKQLKDIPKENYIIEPESKNTAPSTALIAAKIFKKDPDAIIATISADHTVTKTSNYQYAILKAVHFAKQNPDFLVTLGIKPSTPHTGYGYIKLGRKFTDSPAYAVDQFVEKPDEATAKKYLKSGKYLWNAGYFIFRADTILKMFESHAPEIYRGLKDILKAVDTAKEKEIIKKAFADFKKVPIDTAIAEKVKNIAVVPADLGWSDVGSWTSVYDLLENDQDNNVRRGHHIGVGDKNCLFFAQDKLLATVGLEDIVIVDTPDATLVCKKDKTQEIKNLIEKLKDKGLTKYL